jgi:hypothetical protein
MPGVRLTNVSLTPSVRENPAGPVILTAFDASLGSPTTVTASDQVLGAEGESLHATTNDAKATIARRAIPSLPFGSLNMRRINIVTDGSQGQHSGNG